MPQRARHGRADLAHRRHRDQHVPGLPRLGVPAPDARRVRRCPRRDVPAAHAEGRRRGWPCRSGLVDRRADRPDLLPRHDAFGLPSGDTIDQFRLSMRLVWPQFPRAVSPVPSEGSFAIAATTALGSVCSWLADSFAFRAFGRAEAVVPAGVLFIFTAALGTDRNRVLRRRAVVRRRDPHDRRAAHGARPRRLGMDGRGGRRCGRRFPAAVACALFATTGAVAVAPQLPGAGDKALLDTRNREATSPRWSARSSTSARDSSTAATSRCSPWRPTRPDTRASPALSEFDGSRWRHLPEDTRRCRRNACRRPPERRGRPPSGSRSRSSAALWRPPPARRSLPRGRAARCCGPPKRDTLYVDDGMKPGYQYQVTSADNEPSAGGAARRHRRPLRRTRALRLPCRQPPGRGRSPGAAGHRQATTPYDKALALQNWFRTVQVRRTVQSGHSNDAMLNFLRIRQGYCEQFAGTFAAMARVARPADACDGRVHAGRAACRRPVPRLRAPRPRVARGVVRRLRWVLFEPTPGRGAPGAEQHTGDRRGAGRRHRHRRRQHVGEHPDADVHPADRSPAIDRRTGPTGPDDTARSRSRQRTSDGGSAGGWIILAIVLAVLAWVVAMPRVHQPLVTAPDRDPAERVTSAWAATVRSLTMAGAPRARRLHPARVRQVGRRRQGRDRRDRPSRDPRRLLPARGRRRRGRPQRTAAQ